MISVLDPNAVEEQLQVVGPEIAVRDAYLAFANAEPRNGITIRTAGHGYVANELRFEQDGRWLYSAVLNKRWVLWYFRRPAFTAGLVHQDATLARFPDAEVTNADEIKLRVRDVPTARAVIAFIR